MIQNRKPEVFDGCIIILKNFLYQAHLIQKHRLDYHLILYQKYLQYKAMSIVEQQVTNTGNRMWKCLKLELALDES